MLSGRLAAQHHQPHDLPDPGGVPADGGANGRPVPRGRELVAWTWPSPSADPCESVRPTVAGVNHFPVVTALDVDGADGFAILADMVEEAGGLAALAPHPGRPEADSFSRLDFVQRHALKLTLLDKWGAFPAAGDRHIAEFLPWVLTESSHWGADFNLELTSIATRQEHQAGYIADVDAWLDGSKTLQTWASGELPALVIDSLVTGEPARAPGQHPQRRPGAGRGRRRGGRVDLRDRRRRDPGPRRRPAPAALRRAGAPARGRGRADGARPPSRATVGWPRRPSSSTPWPAGATSGRRRPWWTSSCRPRRRGSRSSPGRADHRGGPPCSSASSDSGPWACP